MHNKTKFHKCNLLLNISSHSFSDSACFVQGHGEKMASETVWQSIHKADIENVFPKSLSNP